MPKRTSVTYVAKLDIPSDKIHEYQETFNLFDKDHSGTISVDEIAKIMKNFGNPLSKDEVREMITLMERQETIIDDEDEDEVLRAFKSFDKDHSGSLNISEFRYILTQLGNKFTEE